MQSPDSRPQAPSDGRVLRIGSLSLDPEGFSASIDGRDLALTYGEFLIMGEFLRNPYQVLSRQRLSALLRESSSAVLDTSGPALRSVDTHIARIRAKLRALGYDCIKTMRFVGYRFVPPS